MHRHPHRFLAKGVAAGCHQAQRVTPKLAHSLATLPTLSGPAGSTSTTRGQAQGKQGVEEGQQIGHGLGIGLEARHRRRAATHHLLDQLAIVFAAIHTVQIRAHQSLGRQAVAAGTVESKHRSPRYRPSR